MAIRCCVNLLEEILCSAYSKLVDYRDVLQLYMLTTLTKTVWLRSFPILHSKVGLDHEIRDLHGGAKLKGAVP